jgi:hypothetical protein
MENLNKFPGQEEISVVKIEVKQGFTDFVPQEFFDDPSSYFENNGINIKKGEKKTDETGRVREDPTAVKDLPNWKNKEGQELAVVGKRIDITKGKTGESGDPFYEYKILEKLAELELPAARPIAKVEQIDINIIVMERIPGIRWSERDSLINEKGFSKMEAKDLMIHAQQAMDDLKKRFDDAGIIRKWKLQDMVFQIDFDNKRVLSVIPTDWERTKIKEESS